MYDKAPATLLRLIWFTITVETTGISMKYSSV